jgi:hypothetical protein
MRIDCRRFRISSRSNDNIRHFRTEGRSGLSRKPSDLKVCDDGTVACTSVAMQRPRDKANKQQHRPYLSCKLKAVLLAPVVKKKEDEFNNRPIWVLRFYYHFANSDYSRIQTTLSRIQSGLEKFTYIHTYIQFHVTRSAMS